MLDTETRITAESAAEHGLSPEEFHRIRQILGREPNLTELGIFSVMWSEHCSYKSSKVHLKRLPTRGPQVVQGPGENAGVADIGDGLCAAFKIESHNHPSFVEPFQGAATGVGGILRDIFTMGARPIAVLDALRFGPIEEWRGEERRGILRADRVGPQNDRQQQIPRFARNDSEEAPSSAGKGTGEAPALQEIARNRRILDGVVRGIAHYGNCFGVPTVGGEVQFEPCYAANPLVNVLALGIARTDELFLARARGVGNPVIYVGAKTGRDGIHGASLLASAEFTEESKQKRPNVQVGDPFMEKLLLEACLEVMKTGAVVAIQDMGAAGLTCSTCEMASRGGLGIEIELDRVPQRETSMSAYEIMLSESQERMLLVGEQGREAELLGVFAKWGLDAVVIGQVTDDGLLRVKHGGQVVAEIPAHPLAEEGPVYEQPMARPAERKDETLFEFAEEKNRRDAGAPMAGLTENLRRVLASPAIASKRWIFEQYDYMVRTNTFVGPGAGDAAVVRVKGTRRALALSTDGNGRWCYLSPRVGAMHAVAEAARNVACTGARPWAVTNCLNFGNPEKSEVMWQFSECVDGIAEACTALGLPVTGGNVSFYNQTLGRSIYPTPVIGVLGVLEDAERALGMGFRNEGDVIVLLDGNDENDRGIPRSARNDNHLQRNFSSSEYAKVVQGVVAGEPPAIDLEAEKRLIECLVALAAEGAVQSAHDISDGGLPVAIAECCFASVGARHGSATLTTSGVPLRLSFGADVQIPGTEPVEMALFGERGARAVVSVAPAQLARLSALAAQYKVAAETIGCVGGQELRIQYNGQAVVSAAVESLHDAWAHSIEHAVTGKN